MTTAASGLAYRHPKPRTKYAGATPPRALAVTIARYREDFELRRGPLWDYFAARVPALYDGQGRAGDRRRSLRTDGADSLLCVIVALLQSMDIRRGFIGRPPLEAGGLWHRRSMLELFGFAFGKAVPGALSPRRMERWLRALKALGILTTHQLRRKTARGFESKTAIRHVTDRLFELAGTIGQLAKERRQAWERVRAQRAALRIENMYLDLRAGKSPADPSPVTSPVREAGTVPRAGPPRSAAELLGRIRSPQRRS